MEALRKVREFFHDVLVEFRRVAWPTRAGSGGSTSVVIVMVLVLAVFLGGRGPRPDVDRPTGHPVGRAWRESGTSSTRTRGSRTRWRRPSASGPRSSARRRRSAEVVIPTEKVVEVRKGQKRTTEQKFFPGYVLVEMEMTDDSWHLVKSTPKVTGFVGSGRGRRRCRATRSTRSCARWRWAPRSRSPSRSSRGATRCASSTGPFVNFTGMIEDMNPERGKLKVMVPIFGRPTPVELEYYQVSAEMRWARGATGLWRRRSRRSSSCRSRPGRRTRRRRSGRRSASTASTSWSSARASTPRPGARRG